MSRRAKYSEVKAELEDGSVNPMIVKKELGETLVDMYYPKSSGKSAREEFERVFAQGKLPDDIPEIDENGIRKLELNPESVYLVHLMTRTGMTKSNGEARKLIQSGAVSLDGEKVTDPDYEFAVDSGRILKVGKRRFLRIKAG
jgi:tyrosyl-tRNA synthetase